MEFDSGNFKDTHPLRVVWRIACMAPLFLGIGIIFLAAMLDFDDPWENPVTMFLEQVCLFVFSVGACMSYTAIYLGWGNKLATEFLEEAYDAF